MYNRIVLIGRLTRDPELRYLPSGAPVAGFTLAVDRPFKSQAGERETDFVTITTWRKLAEQASRYLDKGRLVAVEGRLQIRSYETQDGQRRRVAEVVADGIRFLDSGKRNGQRSSAVAEAQDQAGEAVPEQEDTHEAPAAEDDVPF
jgi:single-strand DNA-binding protein